MMTDVYYVSRQVILVATALMHGFITVTALVISPRTAQRKFPHQEHLITTVLDHSPFIMDAAREDASIGQGHTTDLNVAEAPAANIGMHPTPHTTTTTAHDTHPPKDTLGNALTGTHCTDTTSTCLQHTTLHTRVNLMTALLTKADLGQDTKGIEATFMESSPS